MDYELIKMGNIDSLEPCTIHGFISYPPCIRCGEPEKESALIGYRPWCICAKCYIEWLTGE